MIDFNVPPYVGGEIEYIQDAIAKRKICGDGEYTKKLYIPSDLIHLHG